MSRSLLGAGVGAAGATAYLKPEIVQDYVKELVWGPPRLASTGAPVGKELEQLQRLVEDLSRQVAASRQQAVTVVHTGGSSGSSTGAYLLYGASGVVLGVVVYYRVLKGWTFGDMLYATRRGLKEGLASVTQGMEQLGAQIAQVKARLQERIAHVVRKQEEMLGAQAEMHASLAGVGRDVEHTRGQVGQIHAVVMDLEASMAEVGANQRHANHGIYVLCKAVSELMAGSSIPSKSELIEYTQQHPVWAGAERVQGLESLLPAPAGGATDLRRAASARGRDENASPERRAAPFLIGSGIRKAASEGPGLGGLPAPGQAWLGVHQPTVVVQPTSVEVGGATFGLQ
ncbi:NADH-cytochrome b5 reductase 1 isoform A [Micractinium conductrix]|uniref:NADH-cytochrome b5 reductase 1 isoform A n=1 Tax=Micractinium conductrix TaxID=554055 RepID=A0A2P6V2V0_9CHLO|nr:NADH-cytochrome b5 reductase 1 isoform A [Micractinium conductrix]|eukprot:PSC68412.1 NADH-cytochrome b5 reductase 1 isoform A [Micractinium conductrix]